MQFWSIWLLLLAIPPQQASEHPIIKMTIQSTVGGSLNERTIFMQEDRERVEYRNAFGRRQAVEVMYGPRLVRIVRCDLGQSFELNLDTSEYTSAPYPPRALTEAEIKARGLEHPAMPKNPTIRVEVKTSDTGERKEMLGRVARHVITTSTQTPLEGSHSEPQESVTDGWYIDLDQQLSCDPKRPAGRQGYIYASVSNGKQPMEKPEFVRIGEPETGFPLYSRTSSKLPSTVPDATIANFETRVTQFEEGPLDPALFEIPPGFKHVEHIERNPAPALGAKP